MATAAKVPILITAVLATHTAQAADPATSTAPPTLNGAQLFATHCAMCHKPAELARRLQSAADPKAARADMATFLAHHGRSDAGADAAIIDYLANTHGAIAASKQVGIARASAACRKLELPTTLISINERQIPRECKRRGEAVQCR